MYGSATEAMAVSSTSINVASITEMATTHGFVGVFVRTGVAETDASAATACAEDEPTEGLSNSVAMTECPLA